jgi:dTMP kinase
MLITFEGIDASGKSTQIRLLKDYLVKRRDGVLVLREPGGLAFCETIRSILLDNKNDISDVTELLLFSASRAELVRRVIQPALAAGDVVIMDRFYDSTTAYQGFGRGLEPSTIATLNRLASGGLVPDVTFYLDISPEDAMMRKFSETSLPLSFAEEPLDRMESSGIEFYKRVRAGYKSLIEAEPKRFVEISALKSVSEIHTEVVTYLRSKFVIES